MCRFARHRRTDLNELFDYLFNRPPPRCRERWPPGALLASHDPPPQAAVRRPLVGAARGCCDHRPRAPRSAEDDPSDWWRGDGDDGSSWWGPGGELPVQLPVVRLA